MENELITNTDNIIEMMQIITWFIQLAVAVFSIVCSWKLFEKAGEAGWACLIPFYNTYTEFKIAKKQKLFIPYLISSIVAAISITSFMILGITTAFGAFIAGFDTISRLSGIDNLLILIFLSGIIALVCYVVMVVLNILCVSGLAKSFGQGVGFTIGLIFLPIIFRAIIAFSNNIQYQVYPPSYPPTFPPNDSFTTNNNVPPYNPYGLN